MSFLPRTRGGVLWRALLAIILVIGFTAGAVATAGLLQVNNLVQDFAGHSTHINITLPKPGKPETLLLIGSDHRAGDVDYTGSETDTMLLVRIDDSSDTINLMSVPRDLEVLDGTTPVKLNSIYSSDGGPNGLLKVLRAEVFPHLQVNHVIDTNFIGFSDLIDAIGCVYTDVDHRYFNISGPGVNNFSSIDIEPGYQKLCGGVHSETGKNSALAFVRFRHTDSDVVRNARQQDFIRWAKDGYSTNDLLNNQGKLTGIFASHTTTDKSLASEDGLIDLFDLIVGANKLSLKTIQFPEYFGTPVAGQPAYVYPCPELSTCSEGYGGANPPVGEPTEATEAIWNRFITPTKTKASPSKSTTKSTKLKKVKAKVNLNGLTADPGDGASQAGQLAGVRVPIYYPKYIYEGPYVGGGYCFSITANCDETALEPETAYTGSYPRKYNIAGTAGQRYPSYVMTLRINSVLGEYYTVQGTTWKNPPILSKPSKIVHVNRHELEEFDDGGKISLIATKTPQGSYWISNTLNNVIPNSAMIAMGAELTRAKG